MRLLQTAREKAAAALCIAHAMIFAYGRHSKEGARSALCTCNWDTVYLWVASFFLALIYSI